MSTIKDLHVYGGGLNIEGGNPWYRLKNSEPKKEQSLWANVILVLDRPLIDHLLFEELAKDTRYPLLENKIETINDNQFIATYLSIIIYYLENGRELLNKQSNDRLNVSIHFHQDESCSPLITVINDFLAELWLINKNTQIRYYTDNPTFEQFKEHYDDADILLSFSQCAGLDPDYGPGRLLIADTFIPFDLDKNQICLINEYQVNNDIIQRLSDIVKDSRITRIVEYVNGHYRSMNPNKADDTAKPIRIEDFTKTKILQVDRLWNPKNSDEKFSVLI